MKTMQQMIAAAEYAIAIPRAQEQASGSCPAPCSAYNMEGLKTAEEWAELHRLTYQDTHPSVRFIQAVQADAIRVSGNTAAQPGVTKTKAAITILKAASALEAKLPEHLR